MSTIWIEIEDGQGTRVEALNRGLTRLGGRNPEIPLEGSGGEQLHLWDDPPRLVHVGSGEPPRIDGQPLEEGPVALGDRIEWAGAVLVLSRERPAARLQELEPMPAPDGAAPAPGGQGSGSGPAEFDLRPWLRLEAGLLVDLGLADKKVLRRWQESIKGGSFDPDACAGELLEAPGTRPDAGRILERAGRLQRDLVMAPLVRGVQGASRKARESSRNLLAMLVAQLFALGVYSLLVFIGLLLLRHKGVDFNAFFDAILGPLRGDG